MTRELDVLVIDDNKAIAEIVCAAVEMLHMSCRQVDTVAEFMQGVELEPAWIVMDLKMPDMDGPELLRLVAGRGSAARVILMSGSAQHALDEVATEARKLGLQVAGVLVKPFRLSELLALFRSAV